MIEDGSFDYPCNNIERSSKHSQCVRFVRSFAVCQGPGPRQVREQPNNITHYVDGSMIYGSSERELEQLRDGTSKWPTAWTSELTTTEVFVKFITHKRFGNSRFYKRHCEIVKCPYECRVYCLSSNKSRDSNKHHPLIRTAPFHTKTSISVALKSNHNLTMTKLKCILNKYAHNEAIKIISSCGIYKALYHIDSYLLLFGNTKSQSFEIS